jgi:hypothetical protein
MRKIGFALALLTTFSVMDTAEAAMSYKCAGRVCTCDDPKDCFDMRNAGVCGSEMVCDPRCHCDFRRSGGVTQKPPPRSGAKSQ